MSATTDRRSLPNGMRYTMVGLQRHPSALRHGVLCPGPQQCENIWIDESLIVKGSKRNMPPDFVTSSARGGVLSRPCSDREYPPSWVFQTIENARLRSASPSGTGPPDSYVCNSRPVHSGGSFSNLHPMAEGATYSASLEPS